MIYRIEMFHVVFYILAKNEREKEVIDTWWYYFTQNPERGRVSVVLAFLGRYRLEFAYKWSYCKQFTPWENWRAYWGFKRQIREFPEGIRL